MPVLDEALGMRVCLVSTDSGVVTLHACGGLDNG